MNTRPRTKGDGMKTPERDPMIAQSNQEQDVALLKQKVAELERAQQQGNVEGFMDGGPRMRLPNTAHTSRPWRIHEIVLDFKLEDVWALPTPGGPDDFPRLMRQMASGEEPSQGFSGAARALWALRWKVGGLLGW